MLTIFLGPIYNNDVACSLPCSMWLVSVFPSLVPTLGINSAACVQPLELCNYARLAAEEVLAASRPPSGCHLSLYLASHQLTWNLIGGPFEGRLSSRIPLQMPPEIPNRQTCLHQARHGPTRRHENRPKPVPGQTEES